MCGFNVRKKKFIQSLRKELRMLIVRKSLYNCHTIIAPFENLVHLTLERNSISFLPKDLGTLPHLWCFELWNNSLEKFIRFTWKWPYILSPVTNNLLCLNHNCLSKLPLQIICLQNITKLNLSNNEIICLPAEFGTMPQLTVLDLSHNYLFADSTWAWLEQTPIRNSLLSLNIRHNFLTKLPLQIIYLRNIMDLNLSNNEIVCLPVEFGTLPQLMVLDLSDNYLFADSTWAWLDQISIRNSLLSLNICNNFLNELPVQIGRLNTLSELFCDRNILKHLPQNIGNLQFLNVFTLSKNYLSYLPGSIAHLNLTYLNVEDNPFFSYDNTLLHVLNTSYGWQVPSLVECSAKLILNYRIEYNAKIPNVLIRYLDQAKYCCVCASACFYYDLKMFVDYFLYEMLCPMKFLRVTENYFDAMFECYTCSPHCTRSLRTIWNSYIQINFCDDNEEETENNIGETEDNIDDNDIEEKENENRDDNN